MSTEEQANSSQNVIVQLLFIQALAFTAKDMRKRSITKLIFRNVYSGPMPVGRALALAET